jgi:hypothetical protein
MVGCGVSDQRAVRRDVQSCARDVFHICIDLDAAPAHRRRVRVGCRACGSESRVRAGDAGNDKGADLGAFRS